MKKGYVCRTCQQLHDEERFPPKKLRLLVADSVAEVGPNGKPTRFLPEEYDVFLCPSCSEQFVGQGRVNIRLSERYVQGVGNGGNGH